MAETYRCHDCHMTFGTLNLLQKHKQKFCVGGSVGDPDSLLLRRGLRSANEPVGRSISPDEREYQRYNPNQDAQLRQLAENHGRQMEYLQLRNRDLEKQKEDIRRRLEELGAKGRPSGDDQAALLAELRAQEERNQRALEDLRRQLYEINHKRVNVIEVEKPTQQPHIVMPPPVAPPPPPQPDTSRKSYIYPVYYGSSLVAEISAIRQAYLQNGGNDPDVLAQMSQMQAEAQSIEDQMKRDGYDNRHRDKKDKDSLKYLEMENERLHRELLLLQEQNFRAHERKKSDREEELERQLRRLQEEQLRKMLELQGEINALKNRSMLEVYRQPPPPPPPQKAEMPALLQRPYVEVEPMAPYDQYPNRFNKQRLPTAYHSWVTTQSHKPYDIFRKNPFDAPQEEYTEDGTPIAPSSQDYRVSRLAAARKQDQAESESQENSQNQDLTQDQTSLELAQTS